MGVNIGSGWFVTSQNNKPYIQISLDEIVTKMYPQLKDVKLGLYYIEEKTNENAPDLTLQAYIPRPKKTTEENTPIKEKFTNPEA